MRVANKIQKVMNEKKYRQCDLAAATRIPQATLSHCLNPYSNPRLKHLYLIARALGVPVHELMVMEDLEPQLVSA